ncbi:type II methionyl aminopeptidase, partial [Candidatus Pacearchaeota archaeon]|nr:type II methionyl aminopeptidase [Candidatus Pacearchaeota archaeon]
MNKEEIEKLVKAGKIAKQVVDFAKTFIKSTMPLLELAEKLESKIIELGAKPAFPINLSINEVAAHSTPSFNDSSIAQGLIKVDIGVHINGYVADTAISLDLEQNEENKALISAAENALNSAVQLIKFSISFNEIGKIIENTIKKSGFHPVTNLSGHSIEPWNLHAGVTIPNFDNSQILPLKEGLYAVEPFATLGLGSVRDGKPSGIYSFQKKGNVRDSFAREVLTFIKSEYNTLPFCSRWLI